MSENLINEQGKNSVLLKGLPMMVLSIIVILGVLPLGYFLMEVSEGLLKGADIKMTPNIDDGYVLAEFEDPVGDLMRAIPTGDIYEEASRALDIRRFSIKKVKFRPLSGVGIKPRLNMVFHFEGKLPNPHNSKQGFSLPVMHVYIDAPEINSTGGTSNKVVDLEFGDDTWDYQVVVDGMHELPRIFDRGGNLVAEGLGLYLNYEPKEGVKPLPWIDTTNYVEEEIKYSRITAALPMELLGDPEQGEWGFNVVVGLADLRNPSMLYPATETDSTNVFDEVQPHSIVLDKTVDGFIYPNTIKKLE